MIKAFALTEGRLQSLKRKDNSDWLKDATWINLCDPGKKELKAVRAISDLPIPSPVEMKELESSSHSAVYDSGLQVNCLFLHMKGGEAINTNVVFVINDTRVITMSDTDIPEIRLLKNRCNANLLALNSPKDILFELLEMKVDRLADTLEDSYRHLNAISKTVSDIPQARSLQYDILSLQIATR